MTSAEVLDEIREQLMTEAENSLARAAQYRLSKRQGERNSAPIYARRGLAAIEAVTLLDQAVYPLPEPRHAVPPAT